MTGATLNARRHHPADIAAILSALCMGVVAAWIAVAGPTRSLPIHWGWDGVADGFGTRASVAVLLAGLALVTGTLGIGLGVAAREAGDARAARRLRLGQLAALVALTTVAVLGTTASLSGVTALARPVPLALGGGTLALLVLLAGRVVARRRAWQDEREGGSD